MALSRMEERWRGIYIASTQDLTRRCIATRGESVSTYPHRPKVEAFSNAVDVVVRLHDPTDPSTKRTAPPCSALKVQLSLGGFGNS